MASLTPQPFCRSRSTYIVVGHGGLDKENDTDRFRWESTLRSTLKAVPIDLSDNKANIGIKGVITYSNYIDLDKDKPKATTKHSFLVNEKTSEDENKHRPRYNTSTARPIIKPVPLLWTASRPTALVKDVPAFHFLGDSGCDLNYNYDDNNNDSNNNDKCIYYDCGVCEASAGSIYSSSSRINGEFKFCEQYNDDSDTSDNTSTCTTATAKDMAGFDFGNKCMEYGRTKHEKKSPEMKNHLTLDQNASNILNKNNDMDGKSTYDDTNTEECEGIKAIENRLINIFNNYTKIESEKLLERVNRQSKLDLAFQNRSSIDLQPERRFQHRNHQNNYQRHAQKSSLLSYGSYSERNDTYKSYKFNNDKHHRNSVSSMMLKKPISCTKSSTSPSPLLKNDIGVVNDFLDNALEKCDDNAWRRIMKSMLPNSMR